MVNRVRVLMIILMGLASAMPAHAQSYAGPDAGAVDDGSICRAVDGRLPANVQVARHLLPHVRAMLLRSDDFRHQCEQLAARPTVYVRVSVSLVDLPYQFCARSVIQRMAAGPIMAFVELGRTVKWSEWIAHEFEHILEQAEGLRGADMARQSASWESATSVFETSRAIVAGQAVRAQMRRKPLTAAAATN